VWGVGFGRELLRSTKAHAEVRTGVGCGVWGETIHNLRVNHNIKNGFGIR